MRCERLIGAGCLTWQNLVADTSICGLVVAVAPLTASSSLFVEVFLSSVPFAAGFADGHS